MAWIAIADHTDAQFDAQGLGPNGARPNAHYEALPATLLVPKGSLVIETGLSPQRRPQPLLTFRQSIAGPLQISLQAIPGGGLTLVIANGDDLQHCAIGHAETGRTDLLRITYSWDAPARTGLIAVERTGSSAVTLFPVKAPKPILMRDLRALCLGDGQREFSQDVVYFAAATHIEPVGPSPTLTPETPIATPQGYKPAGSLKRGDTVLTASGQVVPVLHRVDCEKPARGLNRPVILRAPYFGLQQDITVAPDQRLVMEGSEVEYLFGHEAVLVPARHLGGAAAVAAPYRSGTIRYCQLLLPGHEALNAAGTAAESLYIGRIRRKPRLLAASHLANLDQAFLPDHGKSLYPVLRAYDAQVLADYRAA
ncbi:Hint domain-containing protein [Aestuariivita boseongensis]|uniref:Hint domain-containing protein n=1 Tax=Aestuariivita boseongensis TaxID=1470562 RepID=UPI00067FA034|nr:Hint domain-containing protein [Aestuariivita boseongensis]